MIHKVEFRNFKALRDVSVELGRLTVLVGPNASGKSSVLEGLYYLSEFGQARPTDWPQPDRLPLRLSASGADKSMNLWCSGELGVLSLRLGTEEFSFTSLSPEGLSTGSSSTGEMYGPNDSVLASDVSPPLDFGPGVFLRLEMSRIAAPSYSDQPIPQMESDGSGLASVLAYMESSRPSDFQNILAALRLVVPTVRSLRFPRAKVLRVETEVIKVDGKEFTRRGKRYYWGNSIEFDMGGAPGIAAHMVSEGTLLVLGLLTVLMGPKPPRLVLLDDLDRALHPKAQEQVVALLRELLSRNPEMQIVATSHSPYLLHHLEPEEVRLTALKEDGSVACGRLEDHPQFEKWKEEMTPGEMWSLFGEKWLVEAEAGGRQ